MTEDDELTDADHLSPHLGDEDLPGGLLDLMQRMAVGGHVGRILFSLNERSMFEECHDTTEVRLDGDPDDNVTRPFHWRTMAASMSTR